MGIKPINSSIGTNSAQFAQILRAANWPSTPVSPRIFEIAENPLVAAAQAVSLVAYPLANEQKPNGPAFRFCGALLADLTRLAKTRKKIQKLPTWAAELKIGSMCSRIARGRSRLNHSFSALQTIHEALTRGEDNRAAKAGEIRTFTIRSSPDFSHMTLTMPIEPVAQEGAIRLVGSIPEETKSSLRAAIIYHRRAFGKGAGDEQGEYVNIRNRYVAPVFSVIALGMVVREELLSKAEAALKTGQDPIDLLLFEPEWATNLVAKVHERQGMAIWMLHRVGIRICACQMPELA